MNLFINSPAQMITEKLKSIVRFGIRNTRYKDVYDICYLSECVNMEQLKDCIQKYIFDDPTLRNVSDMNTNLAEIGVIEPHASDKKSEACGFFLMVQTFNSQVFPYLPKKFSPWK